MVTCIILIFHLIVFAFPFLIGKGILKDVTFFKVFLVKKKKNKGGKEKDNLAYINIKERMKKKEMKGLITPSYFYDKKGLNGYGKENSR